MARVLFSRSDRTAAELRALLVGPPPLTLSAAESVTCGQVQAAIGAISGASKFFIGGITTYSLAEKVRHLGVNASGAEKDNAVSAAVAAEMAIGACRLFRSDLSVATTGYAEPDAARGFDHPGAYWAVARSGGGHFSIVRQGFFEGVNLLRVPLQRAVATEVLQALLDYVRLYRAAEKQSRFV